MKKALILTSLATLLAAVTWWGWRFFRSDERRIAKVLYECAEAAEFRSGEAPAGALLKLRRLESRVEDELDVTLRIRGRSIREKIERKRIIAQLAASRKYLSSLEITLSDLGITVAGDTAVAEASVQLRGQGGGGDGDWKDSVLEEVAFTLTKRNGDWRVASVKARNFMEK